MRHPECGGGDSVSVQEARSVVPTANEINAARRLCIVLLPHQLPRGEQRQVQSSSGRTPVNTGPLEPGGLWIAHSNLTRLK